MNDLKELFEDLVATDSRRGADDVFNAAQRTSTRVAGASRRMRTAAIVIACGVAATLAVVFAQRDDRVVRVQIAAPTSRALSRESTTTSDFRSRFPVANERDFPKLEELKRRVRNVIAGTGDGGPVTVQLVKTTVRIWSGTEVKNSTDGNVNEIWYGVQLIGANDKSFRCTGRCVGRSSASRETPTSRYSTLGYGPASDGGDYGFGPTPRDMSQYGIVYIIKL